MDNMMLASVPQRIADIHPQDVLAVADGTTFFVMETIDNGDTVTLTGLLSDLADAQWTLPKETVTSVQLDPYHTH